MTKTEVRRIAHEANLETADKKDSTGICFIGERRFHEFLKNYIPSQPGNIVTMNGDIIGTHDGLMYYTIGQRKGLGIGGNNNYSYSPWFVVGKRLDKNELIVGQGSDNIYLMSNHCYANNINWITDKPIPGKIYSAKFRYRQKDNDVRIEYINDDLIHIIYDQGVSSVTPGQAVVLYDGDVCLGGGIIDTVYYNDEKRIFY